MAMVGMDVEAVRGVATSLNGQADAIDGVITTIDGLITNAISVWQGSDATQFQDWWNSQHKPALMNAREAIAGLAQSANNNASAQETASAQ
jgi:uncharacterized protein YukE